MAKVNTDKFLELLKRSELVTEDRLSAAIGDAKKRGQGKLPASPEDLADQLIEAKLITRWQAGNLLSGKHKGFKLGRYKLLRHLGTGGMSSVYLAEHLQMRHQVAIKVLPNSKVEDSSYLARFQLEARAAAALKHPNIVGAFDIDNDGKTHYFVMEFIQGLNLQELVKEDGPLSYETAADYIFQTAQGLQHAHDAGVIHRDIKPANLLVDPGGTLKILDMGLAKFSDDEQPSLTIAHDENVLGTADYLAPEQAINSHGVDHRADIYSLGCTLYFLLTGHPPFPEGTLPQRLMKHQTEQPPSIFEDRDDAPQGLVNICQKMMIKSPEGRYQHAQEVADDLKAWLENPARVVANMISSGGGPIIAGDAGTKELRTRKTRNPSEETRPRPVGGDTLSDKDIETFKGPGKSPGDSDSKRLRPRTRSSDSDIPFIEEAKKPKPRAARAKAGTRGTSQDSGEFVFDPTSINAAPRRAGQRTSAKKKRSSSSRSTTRRSKNDTPWWIWAVLAGCVLAVLILGYLLLTR